MEGVPYRRLLGDAKAFRHSALLIESEIQRLSAKPGDRTPIGTATGWPSHSVWESMKTASHFNLGISLELTLKCLLRLNGITPALGRNGHCLTKLFRQLEDDESGFGTILKTLFTDAVVSNPFTLIAFLVTDDPNNVPEGPPNRDIDDLIGFLAYLDEDMQLWSKRYSWEVVCQKQWCHYMDNLDAFSVFLDEVDRQSVQLARDRGLVR